MLGHRREIAVIVEKPVTVLDAEGRDNQVGEAFCRDAMGSQFAIVRRSGERQIDIHHRDERQAAKIGFEPGRMSVIPRATENFEQHDVSDHCVSLGYLLA